MKLAVAGCLAAFLIASFGSIQAAESTDSDEAVWSYQCVDSRCKKIAIDPFDKDARANAVSLQVCRLVCDGAFGTVWPRPTGDFRLGNNLVHVDLNGIEFQWDKQHATLRSQWDVSAERFRGQLNRKAGGEVFKVGGRRMTVKIAVDSDSLVLNHKTDESYRLVIKTTADSNVMVEIYAPTYFGARHGVETLSQLVVFDDIRNELQVLVDVELQDKPVYPHRGFSLDTSRNYVELSAIRRTIDALAMVKMNAFHWHITDSQSFPLVIESHPTLHKYGAYSRRNIYTAQDVRDLVEYSLARGIRIIPELDAPAHVGEGWEKLNVTSCFNFQPWSKFCVEPPCGQLDPTKDKVYDILDDIYREMNAMFYHSDVFHMGGDEVSISCWNSSVEIQQWMKSQGWGLEESDFYKLWNYFQTNALSRLDKSLKDNRPILLWTSHLTEEPYVDQYLNKDRYIIQIWTTGDDPKITKLLQKGYQLIISNYDALYLDCGFAGWVNGGNNWCSPYIGWQKVYNNDLKSIGGNRASQILGAEAALWLEQADHHSLDSRNWPRISALAERLWTDPRESWEAADSRMLIHRERLIENGIAAESLQPIWCLQNEGECPIQKV
ncbi:chitooligosaccharidolytic beta-N-acetylglucosaminidase-like isoform X2 [Uranotaenia lowii]|uniref:chitooligosaccharidolytic beta-N-acetylglucosaminidase-like isoform X2 n=1 Tax=Uranotaenia lowii TaxID=190385 RepID=UPI00247B2CF8|nr:chitooligosaccharidolytic beta-N-acetylglucosaminidase-like isoform X2 [Uranotaenia lowii]XP_055602207.1 chitooligosaccharidolytic beta-N-acetylglucosaminidase-like isoform X2 [Uranotaenia lowii]